MGKYYCLVAGLPNISLEDNKLTYTVADFKDELAGVLSFADKRLVDLFYLKYDNKNLLDFLRSSDAEPDKRGLVSLDDLRDFAKAFKEDEPLPKNKLIPSYITEFLKTYLSNEGKENNKTLLWEDQLASRYYTYAMKRGNSFVSEWFELNLNINNMLTAITCRKYSMDKNLYIVGDNEVADCLRMSNARDFGLGDLVDYLPSLQRIAEEVDFVHREKKVDLLKWQWLDDHTFFTPFDIENVFAYLLKLEMIERWLILDKQTGENMFRQLVGTMKKGSASALEEFKRNNNK